jgi:hypothetical protein
MAAVKITWVAHPMNHGMPDRRDREEPLAVAGNTTEVASNEAGAAETWNAYMAAAEAYFRYPVGSWT